MISGPLAMGCSASFHHLSSLKNALPSTQDFRTVPIPFSRKTKDTLRGSWELVEPVKIEAGKAMFMK